MLSQSPAFISITSVLESEPGRTLDKQHEFVFVLVVPESVGRGVAVGDDPLDAAVLGCDERLGEFVGKSGGEEERRLGISRVPRHPAVDYEPVGEP